MVEFMGKPILEYIMESIKNFKIDEIGIVTGYKNEAESDFGSDGGHNFPNHEQLKSTNMAYSMICARDFLNDDTIISYSDIAYKI